MHNAYFAVTIAHMNNLSHESSFGNHLNFILSKDVSQIPFSLPASGGFQFYRKESNNDVKYRNIFGKSTIIFWNHFKLAYNKTLFFWRKH